MRFLSSRHPRESVVEDNLRRAVAAFVEGGQLCFSIKLGQGQDFALGPFLDPDNPIAPFKEKMIWVSRTVLDDALALPRFSELSIAEDTISRPLHGCATPRPAARCTASPVSSISVLKRHRV